MKNSFLFLYFPCFWLCCFSFTNLISTTGCPVVASPTHLARSVTLHITD